MTLFASLKATPGVILIYGVLGLAGFLGPPLVGLLAPAYGELVLKLLIAYAALILSFLGGARWGLAASGPSPSPITISLAMLPTLFALAIVMLPMSARVWQIGALVLGLALQWLWDVRARGLPVWYPGLRTLLSGGAIAGLVAGALFLQT
ncbi:DUF3429 domain-containing protein [Phenylobacterium sp.]|jgi:hypothetical protein|uniref:DUF3429 domain-containing protein n=1 Tax=Phenylobacterium sp. TaxID=1871053 RepID=UPI0037C50339